MMSSRLDWLFVGSWLLIIVGCLTVGVGIVMLVDWVAS